MALSALVSPFPPPPDLTVERVVDEEGVAQWIDLHPHYLEHDQRDEPRERLYISLGLDGDHPLRHYIARLGGEPVGALSLFLGQETEGIYHSALPVTPFLIRDALVKLRICPVRFKAKLASLLSLVYHAAGSCFSLAGDRQGHSAAPRPLHLTPAPSAYVHPSFWRCRTPMASSSANQRL